MTEVTLEKALLTMPAVSIYCVSCDENDLAEDLADAHAANGHEVCSVDN